MGKQKIDHLTIGAGSSTAIYDRKQSPEELFLEDTDELDVYKVTLREGTYGHNGQELKEGSFEITLSVGGSLCGYVITQMPDLTPEDEPESITLTLKVER
ncbi:putative SCP2 domain-containing protein [Pseudomonas sp. IT-P74]|uniref:hypothetical protein n=1 Tax=Pseudomonas sp. IT-P74 TaxID=3026445 RepID=UPI0039DF9A8A